VKAYLLTYNSVFNPEYVHQILNNTRAIQTWVSPFPYSAIVLSNLTVNELAAVLQTHFAGVWFMLAEVNKDNTNGWLPAQFWEYVGDPQAAWSKRLFAQFAKTLPPPRPALTPPPGLPASLEALLGDRKKKG